MHIKKVLGVTDSVNQLVVRVGKFVDDAQNIPECCPNHQEGRYCDLEERAQHLDREHGEAKVELLKLTSQAAVEKHKEAIRTLVIASIQLDYAFRTFGVAHLVYTMHKQRYLMGMN